MEGLFGLAELEDPASDRLPGTRLQRLEIYNWGTFNSLVWRLEVGGRNTLLTGDIGSGKSTLVDAVTTLLLPTQRISYNKAAGADTRERDLRSYVHGHYKSERNETTGTSRPVGLRDAGDYSVILGVFGNADYESTVTLAQVFWSRDAARQPERFFVVADGDLSIGEDFSGFGSDITTLRRRLRDRGITPLGGFPEYGREFRRRLGIESEQALDLFLQTVSMKAVDNLNDFVRQHMLEPFDVSRQLKDLIAHFDDLTRAHTAVLRARAQLELLGPLVGDLDAHAGLERTVAELTEQRSALPFVLAERKVGLVEAQLASLEAQLHRCERERFEVTTQLDGLVAAERDLSIEIAGSGGDRIAALQAELARLAQLETERRRRFDRFNDLLAAAEVERLASVEAFAPAQARAAARLAALQDDQAELENDQTERRVELRRVQQEAAAINDELRSLQNRRSNLPEASLKIRARLCADLRLDPEDLPFAGELLQVRAESAAWEGAAERVLHGFALSLLVPNAAYDGVRRWVDEHHLGARLVYYRVPDRLAPQPEASRRAGQTLLVDCLEVRPGSRFGPWVEAQLERRAGLVCVADVADFSSVTRGVTRAGQVKDSDRHEKDDRRRIDDRLSYALGWSNEAKVEAVLAEAIGLNDVLHTLATNLTGLVDRLARIRQRLGALTGLAEYTSASDLDWEQVVRETSARRRELTEITTSSDRLRTLTRQRAEVLEQIAAAEEQRAGLDAERGGLEGDRTRATAVLAEARQLLADPGAVERSQRWAGVIGERAAAALAPMQEAGQLDRLETTLVADWTRQIERTATMLNSTGLRCVRRMGEFRTAYPEETSELDESLASGEEFRELHQRVARDDLPRFEAEFKRSLNQNTIHDVAMFSAQLNKQEQLIRERVGTINESLVTIDYNPERYIRLLPDRTPNLDVREFIADLRACTDRLVGDADDQYSEQKFLQVKRLVDRLRGREGMTEVDRAWSRRVTDVRNWFIFSASERWHADDTEYENYADSGGKSGGQKEKLAYTILAASLAYQFKLDYGAAKSRSFRFVVIDEAFGRGSEESTRYALRLFTKLGLQLMVVTPLQKIHVIEPHVSVVGYVDNLTGDHSRLQGMSITEYRRQRDTRG